MSLFQSNLRKQIRKLPEILKSMAMDDAEADDPVAMDDADELEAGVIGSLAFLQTRLLGGTTGRDFSRRSLGLAATS